MLAAVRSTPHRCSAAPPQSSRRSRASRRGKEARRPIFPLSAQRAIAHRSKPSAAEPPLAVRTRVRPSPRPADPAVEFPAPSVIYPCKLRPKPRPETRNRVTPAVRRRSPPRPARLRRQRRRFAPRSRLDRISVQSRAIDLRSNGPNLSKPSQYRSAPLVLQKSPCSFRKSTRSPPLYKTNYV